MSSYLIVVADVPGVVATGTTLVECTAEMADAAFHIEGRRESGESVPPPSARGAVVEVAA